IEMGNNFAKRGGRDVVLGILLLAVAPVITLTTPLPVSYTYMAALLLSTGWMLFRLRENGAAQASRFVDVRGTPPARLLQWYDPEFAADDTEAGRKARARGLAEAREHFVRVMKLAVLGERSRGGGSGGSSTW
ncbi:MAG: hypothetical protein ACK41V_23875, partial [Acidovorax sp.]|uniref:hypothetical protein n=1 Tax=Acidovorax sp. TaxID=1872122 RepID=UPI00391AD7D6